MRDSGVKVVEPNYSHLSAAFTPALYFELSKHCTGEKQRQKEETFTYQWRDDFESLHFLSWFSRFPFSPFHLCLFHPSNYTLNTENHKSHLLYI